MAFSVAHSVQYIVKGPCSIMKAGLEIGTFCFLFLVNLPARCLCKHSLVSVKIGSGSLNSFEIAHTEYTQLGSRTSRPRRRHHRNSMQLIGENVQLFW